MGQFSAQINNGRATYRFRAGDHEELAGSGKELELQIDMHGYLDMIGRSSAECYVRLIKLFGGAPIFQRALAQVRAYLANPANQPVYPLMPGVNTVLSALNKANIPCAVASSSHVQEIKSRLEQVDVLKYVDVVAGGDEVAVGKPDPAVYKLAAFRLQKSPHDCLAFKDSENGMLAASRSGMKVVVAPDLKRPATDMLENSLLVLNTLEEAIHHIQAWFGLSGPSEN